MAEKQNRKCIANSYPTSKCKGMELIEAVLYMTWTSHLALILAAPSFRTVEIIFSWKGKIGFYAKTSK